MTALLLALGLFSTAGIAHAESDGRFAAAGLTEAQVRKTFDALQAAVGAGDADAVSRLVLYPVRVNVPGRPRRLIRDRRAFVAAYKDLFDAKLRSIVRRQRFEDLRANWEGVMFGHGELWIGGMCEQVTKALECKHPRFGIISINQMRD